jgi:hypothetical protein
MPKSKQIVNLTDIVQYVIITAGLGPFNPPPQKRDFLEKAMNYITAAKAMVFALVMVYIVALTTDLYFLPALVDITIQSRFVDWQVIIAIAILVPAFLAALTLFICTVIRKCWMILHMRA